MPSSSLVMNRFEVLVLVLVSVEVKVEVLVQVQVQVRETNSLLLQGWVGG